MVAIRLEPEGGTQSFRSCISFDLEIDRSRLIELCWRNFFPFFFFFFSFPPLPRKIERGRLTFSFMRGR